MKAASQARRLGWEFSFLDALKKIDLRSAVFALLLLVFGYLTLIPLFSLFWNSFHPGWELGDVTPFTFASYGKVFGHAKFFEMVWNTVIFGLGATFLAVGLGSIFAWLVERTNMPFRNVTYALLFAPVAIPGLVFAISYILLLSPQIGVLNKFLMFIFGLEQAPFDIYNLTGLIFVEGIRLTPGSFLMMSAVLKSMDPSLEEAAYTSGTGVLRTARAVTAPLMLPGILAAFIYYFITVIESFEIPAIIALPVGLQLLTTKIFFATRAESDFPDYSVAAAVSILFVIVSALLIYFYSRATKHAERFTTVTGKAYRPRIIDLGRWRYAALAFTALFFSFSVVFPLLVLIWGSLLPYLQAPSLAALSEASFDGYLRIGQIPNFALALKNTAYVTVAVATTTMVLSSLAAWFVVRARLRRGRLKTFFLITLRLLIPAFVNGCLYAAMLSIALFTIPGFLYTPKTVVFSVLIWNLWQNARVQDACVVGVLMVVITFTLVFVGQYFASRAKVQQTPS